MKKQSAWQIYYPFIVVVNQCYFLLFSQSFTWSQDKMTKIKCSSCLGTVEVVIVTLVLGIRAQENIFLAHSEIQSG